MAGNKKSTLLRDVQPENCFWCCNGMIFKNLYELESGLKNMSDEVYAYHAGVEKNDFSNWINDIIGDVRLALELRRCRSRDEAYRKVSNKIKSLK